MILQYVTFRWRLRGLERRGSVGSRLMSPVQHLIFHHCTHILLPLTFSSYIVCACVEASVIRNNHGFPSSRDNTSPNKGYFIVDL